MRHGVLLVLLMVGCSDGNRVAPSTAPTAPSAATTATAPAKPTALAPADDPWARSVASAPAEPELAKAAPPVEERVSAPPPRNLINTLVASKMMVADCDYTSGTNLTLGKAVSRLRKLTKPTIFCEPPQAGSQKCTVSFQREGKWQVYGGFLVEFDFAISATNELSDVSCAAAGGGA